jgi:hypothetical protein
MTALVATNMAEPALAAAVPSAVTGTVRARGLEPPRAEAHRDLNPARLPVPPRPRNPRIERERSTHAS